MVDEAGDDETFLQLRGAAVECNLSVAAGFLLGLPFPFEDWYDNTVPGVVYQMEEGSLCGWGKMFQHYVADLVMSRALPVLQVSEALSQLPEAEGAAGVLFVATAFLLEDCPGLSGGRTVLAAVFHSREFCIDLAEQVRLLTIRDSVPEGLAGITRAFNGTRLLRIGGHLVHRRSPCACFRQLRYNLLLLIVQLSVFWSPTRQLENCILVTSKSSYYQSLHGF